MGAIGFIDSAGLPHLFDELRHKDYRHNRSDWWGLPKACILALTRKPHVRTSDVTVSELIGDPQQQLLRQRHEYYVDPRDQLWSQWGSAIHAMHEAVCDEGQGEVSFRWQHPESGLLVGCRVDALEDGVLWDWKTTSVYTTKRFAKHGLDAKPEWKDQLMLNAALAYLSEPSVLVTEAGVVAYSRDWRPKESQEIRGYPAKETVGTMPIHLDLCIALLLEKMDKWVAVKDKRDEELPECGDLWAPLYDGRPSRCVRYCEVRQFCRQYKAKGFHS